MAIHTALPPFAFVEGFASERVARASCPWSLVIIGRMPMPLLGFSGYRMTGVQVPVSWIRAAAVASVAAWAFWLFLLWQPSRQVELHTLNLLARASSRDWPAVEAMMAPDYRDAWGHDRATAIDDARQLFSHFFALQIVPLGSMEIVQDGDDWEVRGRIGVFGSGTAVAQAVIEEVQTVEGPATFLWRKSGAWPWQWSLAEVRHEQLAGRWPR